jgi:hypothetical protein
MSSSENNSNSPIIFLVTGADHVHDCNPIIKKSRYIEYMIALHKIFYYSYPVIGVLSEVDKDHAEDRPPFESFPFQTLITIQHGELDGYNKSIREGISILRLLQEVPSIHNDTFMIKVSGRYVIMDDSFISIVKQHTTNHTIVAVVRSVHNNTGQFTFLYALRYHYMREFYERYLYDVHDTISVEYRIFDFLKEKKLLEHTIMVDKLGILTNINNEGVFRIF